jgi:hypothetical protein
MTNARIKYLDQLPDILDKYGISKGDVCIIGSSVLSVFALKENNDLDIVIKPCYKDDKKKVL